MLHRAERNEVTNKSDLIVKIVHCGNIANLASSFRYNLVHRLVILVVTTGKLSIKKKHLYFTGKHPNRHLRKKMKKGTSSTSSLFCKTLSSV